MLSFLVFGFVCAIPSSCLFRFPDGNTQNTTFRSETVVTKIDVLRILLNQETLMRMTLVKDVHSLMKDIIDMKVNLATSKKQLHDAMKEISILTSEVKLLQKKSNAFLKLNLGLTKSKIMFKF